MCIFNVIVHGYAYWEKYTLFGGQVSVDGTEKRKLISAVICHTYILTAGCKKPEILKTSSRELFSVSRSSLIVIQTTRKVNLI